LQTNIYFRFFLEISFRLKLYTEVKLRNFILCTNFLQIGILLITKTTNTDTQMDYIKHVILPYIRNIKRFSMSKIIRILSEMGSEKRVLVTFSRMNFCWHRCQDLSYILIHSGTFKCCDHDLNILTCISSTF
jgi:hypothetical protein